MGIGSKRPGARKRPGTGDLVACLAVMLRDAQPPFLQRSEIRDMHAWAPTAALLQTQNDPPTQ